VAKEYQVDMAKGYPVGMAKEYPVGNADEKLLQPTDKVPHLVEPTFLV
jgi:hypothetical protein